MATERVIERPEEPTRTTVIERRGSGGATALIVAFAALALVAIVAFFVLQSNRNDTMRTEAIGDAAASMADSASTAASGVADAAGDAADSVGQAAGAPAQDAGATAERSKAEVSPE